MKGDEGGRAQRPQQLEPGAALRFLARALGRSHPVGYLRGKTRMRDLLLDHFGVSSVEAERVVDQLEARGDVRFEGDPRSPDARAAVWRLVSKH